MSTGPVTIACESQGCYRLDGPLIFKTVTQLHKQSHFLTEPGDEVQIDLQYVESIDSAGVALLLDWTERATKLEKKIIWLNTPEQMTRLVRINGLEQVFGQLQVA